MQPQDFTRWHEVSLRDTEGGVAISSEIPRCTRNGVCVICGLFPIAHLCAPVVSFFPYLQQVSIKFLPYFHQIFNGLFYISVYK